ncbi:MFS general substrate transporter [Metschnikowia bicuspidata var. bicuspidata NRRL YB-4993]|uniref:MFS general substrate transporter n=1 Tax=Metschnikowia bicuspidata var. bicuspidata NRRL YB-4993 TaxID=869754 RepID=A0A1A0HI03_9ASCO|nr:MFS general substrate transporter [Metschnikowia bicuspidata var. bicuspidata NRRL YB-4993]OBA23473.1 MFS general substrate transporter [Metschnikowia bicuspidata var. bicuspidata NRRL YB-4993]
MTSDKSSLSSTSSLYTFDDPEEISRYILEENKLAKEYADLDLQRLATKTTILSRIANSAPANDEDYIIDLERLPIEDNGEQFKNIDPELVTWAHDSHENPRNWRIQKKVYVVLLVSLYTFVSPISASILSPASKDIAKDFDLTSPTILALVTSIHILGWVFGPLVIAPLSENDGLGRKIILNWTCWITFCFNLACAFSQNITQLLILRFCSGLFSATPLNVSPAVVSDMFDAKSRNTSLAGVFLIPFIGAAIAPVIGGYVVEAKGWRWVLLTLSIINGSIALIGSVLLKETFSPALLHTKAKHLRKATGNQNLHTIYELSGDGLTLAKLQDTVTRPLVLLFTNPLVFGLGSFMAFIYGFLYLMIVTFPSVFEDSYGFSQSSAGLMFLALGIGFVFGVIIWTIALGYVYDKLVEKHGVAKPEFRLPCLFISAVIMPIGLFWYGWSVEYKLHWIMPCLGSGIFAFGLVCVFQTLQAYLIDMNPTFAASSIAAASIFRFLLGFLFPLFASSMYDKMGYGWGNTMCGILAILLGIPFPFLCYKYGERLRTWANERMEKSEEEKRAKKQEALRRRAQELVK